MPTFLREARKKSVPRLKPFRVRPVPLVSVVGAAACIYVMLGLPRHAWERFGIWLAVGLIIYFAYGFSHSRLRTAGRR